MADDTNLYEKYLPVIDVNDGLKRVMNKKELYLRLLGKFDVRKMADTLLAEMSAGDHEKIVAAAHAIKGASGNLGLMQLKDMMAEVEAKAKAAEPTLAYAVPVREAVDKTEHMVRDLLASAAVS